MKTAIALFTRDLRVHDNPALVAGAAEAEYVLPLFVLDPQLVESFGAPIRLAFLEDCLRDLAASLGGLAIRQGDTVAETVRVARQLDAHTVFLAEDASMFASRRERRLREQLEVRSFPSTSVVPLDELQTTGGGAYKVFTPYWRAWQQAARRPLEQPLRIRLPPGVEPGRLPRMPDEAAVAAERWPGGETEARRRMARFVDRDLARYDDHADDLGADATSKLSPYLHLGCLSPLELATRAARSERIVRQLCWRDFFLQLLAANPTLPVEDFRRRRVDWNEDQDALDAWRNGQTGYPIIDAAMRQLAAEGWLHNRARLVVASFLTKTLRIHWRHGADTFASLLVDGDLASNSGNWQWIAGTGTDPRPNRVLNPIRQALRHDPSGNYVRRYVPELAAIESNAVHTPWKLGRKLDYPRPIVDPT